MHSLNQFIHVKFSWQTNNARKKISGNSYSFWIRIPILALNLDQHKLKIRANNQQYRQI